MRVHLAWLGSDVPVAVSQHVGRLQRTNADCDVRLYTDGGEVPSEWRGVYDAVSFSPRLQSDILRHAVLRRHGGLWLDVDVTARVPLTTLVQDFTTYTAMYLRPTYWIGTDILYVPQGWGGWPSVHQYITSASLQLPVSTLLFAHDMVARLVRSGESVHLVNDGVRFPCQAVHVTSHALVWRCGYKPGLGDMVASGLSAVGITKDRVQAVAQAVGVKDCGCAKRQAALNRLGEKLGLPPGQTPAS